MHKPKTNSDNIVSIRHALSECGVYYQTESKHTMIVNDQTSHLMRTIMHFNVYIGDTRSTTFKRHLSAITPQRNQI